MQWREFYNMAAAPAGLVDACLDRFGMPRLSLPGVVSGQQG